MDPVWGGGEVAFVFQSHAILYTSTCVYIRSSSTDPLDAKLPIGMSLAIFTATSIQQLAYGLATDASIRRTEVIEISGVLPNMNCGLPSD